MRLATPCQVRKAWHVLCELKDPGNQAGNSVVNKINTTDINLEIF